MKKSIFLLLLAVCIIPSQAEIIDLNQSISHAVVNSPLAAEKIAIRLADTAEQLDRNRLTNPAFGIEFNQEGILEAALEQPLRLSDIAGSRQSYKRLLNEINTLEERLDLLSITQQTEAAYYDLYILQEEESFSRQRLGFLNQAKKYINNSINFNGMNEADVITFEADVLAAQTESNNLRFTLEHEYMIFLRFLNVEFKDITLKTPDTVSLPNLEAVLNAVKSNPSPKKMLELKRDRAEKELRVFNQDRRLPVITPGVKYKKDNDELSGLIALEVPLWDSKKNQYEVHLADLTRAKALLSVFDNIPLDEIIKRAYGHLSNQIETVNAYHTKILPIYQKGVTKIEDNFLRGQASVIEVWQIREKQLDAQAKYLGSLKTLLNAKTDLELLIGIRLEDIQ